MPYVETSIIVKGPKTKAYEIAKKMDEYPRFMENVKEVTIIEREVNSTISSWITNVDGRVIKWKEKDHFDEVNQRIVYKQTEGDLKKFEGEWRFEEVDGGTKIVLTVDFEFGIPMIAALLNPILKKKTKINCEAMLQAIKEQVEETA